MTTTESSAPAIDVPRTGEYAQRRRRFAGGPLVIPAGRLLVAAVFLGAWQLVGSVPGAEHLLGSPADVATKMISWIGDAGFWGDVGVTLRGALIGYLLGVGAACVAVALSWPFAWVRDYLTPFLAVANAIPRIALAPLFILWFGLGTTTSALFTASIIFLIVYLNLFNGLSSIDVVYVQNARVLGARRLWLAASVYVPAVTGWLMNSLRLAMVWAVLGAAVAEYLTGTDGLGASISKGNILGDPVLLVAAATVIALLSLGAERVLVLVERRFSQWRLF